MQMRRVKKAKNTDQYPEIRAAVHALGLAHKFLADNPGDLVSLSQILGHENLDTTKRYVQRTQDQLGEAAERLVY